MAMQAKLIDVTQSLLITDPNSFLSNLRYVTEEDKPEKADPIIAFECYNVLPTSYGYRSYFGDNASLDISALSSRCDRIFLFQLDNLKNILIALCEDGLWYSSSTTISASAWTQGITLSVPTPGTYKEWTYCIIENKLYVYREGEASYWTMEASDYSIASDLVTLNITAVVPSFLNMAGQIGIFRANTSLGFWDSANSISWSSPLDKTDFTPSLTTLAGNAIFSGILGKIVIVKSQGNNYIVYTTKGVVGIRYVNSTTFIWEASTISDTAGISSSKEVTTSITEMEHYAYTNTGIKKIGNYNALTKVHTFEEVFTDIYDLIRENSPTVYLEFLNGRYLLISLIEDDYISGKVSTVLNILDPTAINILVNGLAYDGISQLPSHIGGDSLADAIKGELNYASDGSVLASDGMYLEWQGTGVGSFSANTTPMHYFELDGSDNYVPNPTTDSGPNFIVFGDAESAPVGTYVVESTPDFPDDFVDLGYRTYGSLPNGVAQLGVIGTDLSTFIAAQLAEWSNFILTQTNNAGAIASIPNSAPTAFTEVAREWDLTNVAQKIKDLSEAFANSTNGGWNGTDTVTYLDHDYGSFLSGAGTTEAAILSGVGTNFASYEVTRNFSGGYNPKKYKTRVYSSQLGDMVPKWRVLIHTYWFYGQGVRQPWYVYGDTKIDAYNQFFAFTPVPGPIYNPSLTIHKYLNPHILFDVDIGGGDQNLTVYNYDHYAYDEYADDGGFNFYYIFPTTDTTGEYNYDSRQEYIIGYTETSHIAVENDNTITGSSTLTANQHNLTWGTATTPTGSDPAYPLTDPTGQFLVPGFNIAGGVIAGGDFGYTYPGADYLLQDGVPSPIYPTYVGALVYDTALKKWGKMVHEYTALLDYNIYNGANNNKAISFSDFGIDMAILKDTGVIYNMDVKPAESFLLYGKIGASRRGMSTLYEVRASFRLPSTCTLSSYSSLSGVVLDSTSYSFNDITLALSNNLFTKREGKYHVVKVSGIFDLDYLEVRLNHSGNR